MNPNSMFRLKIHLIDFKPNTIHFEYIYARVEMCLGLPSVGCTARPHAVDGFLGLVGLNLTLLLRPR